jgi:hypothetical protein
LPPIAIESLIERGVIDARDALPLIGFRVQWDFDRLTEAVFAKCQNLVPDCAALLSRGLAAHRYEVRQSRP